MKKSQHVIPNGSKWSVKKTGSIKASKTFDTKVEAENFGKKVAKNQNVELYIHGKDGRVESKIDTSKYMNAVKVNGKDVNNGK